jgi:hypothetical protein
MMTYFGQTQRIEFVDLFAGHLLQRTQLTDTRLQLLHAAVARTQRRLRLRAVFGGALHRALQTTHVQLQTGLHLHTQHSDGRQIHNA